MVIDFGDELASMPLTRVKRSLFQSLSTEFGRKNHSAISNIGPIIYSVTNSNNFYLAIALPEHPC